MRALIVKCVILSATVCGVTGFAMGGEKTEAATWKMSDAKVYTGKKKAMKIKRISKAEKECLKWKSSDKKIATVDVKGKVRGVRMGTAQITARVKGKKKKVTATVTVIPYVPVKRVSIKEKPELYLVEKEKFRLETEIEPLNASYQDIEWKSSNKKVASISKKGRIRP